jgi:hypothetical protein
MEYSYKEIGPGHKDSRHPYQEWKVKMKPWEPDKYFDSEAKAKAFCDKKNKVS